MLVGLAADIDKALAEKTRRFSALRLADGTFWDDPVNKDLANHEQGAHYRLIQAIVEADQDLDGHNKPLLRRLLVLTVLIKYLEDRRVFPDDWFSGFHPGAGQLLRGIGFERAGQGFKLLSAFQEKFNGDLFTLPGDVSLDSEHFESSQPSSRPERSGVSGISGSNIRSSTYRSRSSAESTSVSSATVAGPTTHRRSWRL